MSTPPQAARATYHVDLPKAAQISHPIEHIWAWVAVAARPASMTARVEGTELACGMIDRGGPGRTSAFWMPVPVCANLPIPM